MQKLCNEFHTRFILRKTLSKQTTKKQNKTALAKEVYITVKWLQNSIFLVSHQCIQKHPNCRKVFYM